MAIPLIRNAQEKAKKPDKGSYGIDFDYATFTDGPRTEVRVNIVFDSASFYGEGVSRCRPGDHYDEGQGFGIALARAIQDAFKDAELQTIEMTETEKQYAKRILAENPQVLADEQPTTCPDCLAEAGIPHIADYIGKQTVCGYTDSIGNGPCLRLGGHDGQHDDGLDISTEERVARAIRNNSPEQIQQFISEQLAEIGKKEPTPVLDPILDGAIKLIKQGITPDDAAKRVWNLHNGPDDPVEQWVHDVFVSQGITHCEACDIDIPVKAA